MDKETLSHYGWIVIVVLVLAVMLAFATPFGTYVGDAVVATTKGFGSITENNLNEDSIKEKGDAWENKLENGVGFKPEPPSFVGTVKLSAVLGKASGGEYDYTLSIYKDNDISINSMMFSIGYNKNKAEYVKYSNGGLFSNCNITDDGGSARFYSYANKNTPNTGKIISFGFNAKSETELDISDFTFTPGSVTNLKGEYFNVKITGITVKGDYDFGTIVNPNKPKGDGFNPGDINNDGYINAFDFALLWDIIHYDVLPPCKAADVTGDGDVSIADAVIFMRYLSKDPDVELVPSSATDETIPLDYITN